MATSVDEDESLHILVRLSQELPEKSWFSVMNVFQSFCHNEISLESYKFRMAQIVPFSEWAMFNSLIRSLVMEECLKNGTPIYSIHINDQRKGPEIEGQITEKTKNESQSQDPSRSRLRTEWSYEEDMAFLKGLEEFGLDFGRIGQYIPDRSRSQIRTHYRYLARSILNNKRLESGSSSGLLYTPKSNVYRRLKKRGRPNRSQPTAPDPKYSALLQELSRCIEKLEKKRENDLGSFMTDPPTSTNRQSHMMHLPSIAMSSSQPPRPPPAGAVAPDGLHRAVVTPAQGAPSTSPQNFPTHPRVPDVPPKFSSVDPRADSVPEKSPPPSPDKGTSA
mmetsp:Transcript_53363/g.133981  ORF Transcript_53363/g.133981 Transcript_53363/m.133981 type:complete len:334 (+) Transcript_53363:85-1086(+)|eukprot:CAMPEP_0177635980 /NCGR_PEP_ID=MMETSP0447-20121125/4193_1 /TAXON_ID=0 /ORGANISM="Stygamoeba regulata, Strain BSH-02190019" /LENGTH=333 /DNA_ID=CAMNT_0019137809 /DNA_START=32 /DNA_END=1033 /DNA_ORIENTATION=-